MSTRRKIMPTRPADKQRIAKEPNIGRLRSYIASAAATIQADDLTSPDAWENLIYDLQCALAVAQAKARRFEGRSPC
jgi:hypothetical protein